MATPPVPSISNATGPGPNAAPRGLVLLRRCLLMVSLPMVFISFALPLRAKELGASGFEIGLLYSVFTVMLLVVRPLVGIGLDRFGRRPFLLAAIGVYALTNVLFVLSDQLALNALYAARLLQGTGMAFLLITADTITADLTEPDNRSAAMGGNIEQQGRGGMIGATIGFSLVGAVPLLAWTWSFTIFAVVTALALIFAWRLPETLATSGDAMHRTSFAIPTRLRRLLLVVFLVAFAANLIAPLYLVYLQDRFGFGIQILAAAFLPVGLVYALIPARLGRWTGKWPRARVMAVALLAAGAIYALVPLGPNMILVVGCFVGAAVATIAVDLTRNAWVGDMVASKFAGRAFGVTEFAAAVGATAGPLAGGLIYDHWAPAAIFRAGAVVFVVAGLLTLLVVAARSQEHN